MKLLFEEINKTKLRSIYFLINDQTAIIAVCAMLVKKQRQYHELSMRCMKAAKEGK